MEQETLILTEAERKAALDFFLLEVFDRGESDVWVIPESATKVMEYLGLEFPSYIETERGDGRKYRIHFETGGE